MQRVLIYLPSQGVNSSSMFQISYHRDCQAIDSTNLFTDSEHIQQSLFLNSVLVLLTVYYEETM
jgi:hypothetical protein